MPPSTGALLETHYTGLNILLALAHNTSTTGRSHENIVQQWEFFSSGKINNYHIIHKNTEDDDPWQCFSFFFFGDTIKKLYVESAKIFQK